MFKERVRLQVLVVSQVWLVLASVSIWNCTKEDGYICFRHAENMAHGFGLVLNQGERVEAYTDFLWVALLAGATKLTSNPILVSKLLGTLFNLLALLACYYLCQLIATDDAPMHGIALAATATNGYFIASGVEGLEGPLFVMLLSWLAVVYFKGLRAAGAKQLFWLSVASVLSGLLVMTRPDGALAYVLLWLHAAWRFRQKPRSLLAFSLPIMLVYVPYFLWRWHYYGLFFPNTYYAKGGGTLALFSQGTRAIGSFLMTQSVGILLATLVGSFIIFFPCVETTVLGLLTLSRLLFEIWSGGVSAGSDRFLVPALPLIWLLTERLFMRWLGPNRFGHRGKRWLVAASGLFLAAQLVLFAHYRDAALMRDEAALQRAHVAAGKWLKANAEPGASVATTDIGAIGYWSGLRIIDLGGLGDTTISHSPGVFLEKGDAHYVLSQRPDYVFLHARLCGLQSPEDVTMVLDRKIYMDSSFRGNFSKVKCWDFFPNDHLVLFKRNSTWP